MLIGWRSWSQRATRVASRDNAEVPTHAGRIGSHPRMKNTSISLQTPTRGRKRRSPGSIPPRKVWKPQPNWLVANWLRLMESARGEGCPSGQRRGPAAPGEDGVLSPDLKSLHIYTTNSNNLVTETEIPQVGTAPHNVETPTTLAGC